MGKRRGGKKSNNEAEEQGRKTRKKTAEKEEEWQESVQDLPATQAELCAAHATPCCSNLHERQFENLMAALSQL